MVFPKQQIGRKTISKVDYYFKDAKGLYCIGVGSCFLWIGKGIDFSKIGLKVEINFVDSNSPRSMLRRITVVKQKN